MTGKHEHLNRVHCDAIARKLGTALCAPIIHFVPQGDIDPPSGMMLYRGSIGVSEATYRALLIDVANSFRVTGFQHVVFIGDSGGNQRGMKEVAAELAPKWAGRRAASITFPSITTGAKQRTSRPTRSAGSRATMASMTTP